MFRGSCVALVTPMKRDGEVDVSAIKKLVAFHLENNTQAIVAVGTTGESATLSVDEHKNVVETVLNEVNGRCLVIAGTGSNCTGDAIAMTRWASSVGVDGCLTVTPYYNKPTQEGLYQHFTSIADSVDTPVILYNVPGRTSCDLEPETVARLADLPNIVGIKEAVPGIERLKMHKKLSGNDFLCYSGDDATSREFLLAGGDGVISVTANIAPDQMQKLCIAALEGNAELAQDIDDELAALHEALFLESNPIPAKWCLAELGLIEKGGIRLPLTWFAEDFYEKTQLAMQVAGVKKG